MEKSPNLDVNILHLNDDCLYAIFDLKYVSVANLCSLAQTCNRFKEIGTRIFERKHKVCNFIKMAVKRTPKVCRVLQIFGATITELRIRLSSYSNPSSIVDSIITNCGDLKSLSIVNYTIPDNQESFMKMGLLFEKLEKLHLRDVDIEGPRTDNLIRTHKGTLINFFTKCQSLIDLKIVQSYQRSVFECMFPKLEHFEFQLIEAGWLDYNIEGFLLRHRHLKSFTLDIDDRDYFKTYLEILPAACRNLEKLSLRLDSDRQPQHSVSYDSIKSLARIKMLKDLKVVCAAGKAAENLMEVLPQLSTTLESLHLRHFMGSSAFIPAVTQLKNLRILRLHDYHGSKDINPIGELTQLVELSLDILGDVDDFDFVELVQRLTNLKKFIFNVNRFVITTEIYRQLVDVVGNRTEVKNRHLEVDVRRHHDVDSCLCQTVEFKSFYRE